MNYKRYNFYDLVYILKILRGKNGCPWDREQTHESLKKYLVEETYEVLDAMEDDEKFCDELGDLMLQIVFHTQISKERNAFDIEDVINCICDKMIRRHTHVFSDDNIDTAEGVLENWDKIKSKEKGIKNHTRNLKETPRSFPNLLRSYEVQKKAARIGFDWDSAKEAFKKVKEELNELEESIEKDEKSSIEEEIGDLIFSIVNVARYYDIQPEIALNTTIEKFINRFEHIEDVAKEKGKYLEDMTLEEMDSLWDEAKEKFKKSD